MSIEETNTSVETVTDDLDAFSAELFGQSKADPEEATSEATEVVEEQESDATSTEDTQTEAEDNEPSVDADDEGVEEAKAKPKKNRFQERIDELTAKAREAERREADLKARLEEVERKNKPVEPANTEAGRPSPNDKNEDGTDKYPLGEFDPTFNMDLVKFTLDAERKERERSEQEAKERQRQEAEAQALTETWNEQLVSARERYPDFQEKGLELTATFDGIDEQYGEYLMTTIMSMDNGADVLYHLANNIDEAQRIVESGARQATIALGRLDARFERSEAPEPKPVVQPKITKAPAPPPTVKGSAPVVDVRPDTDDLEAFERLLFKKK